LRAFTSASRRYAQIECAAQNHGFACAANYFKIKTGVPFRTPKIALINHQNKLTSAVTCNGLRIRAKLLVAFRNADWKVIFFKRACPLAPNGSSLKSDTPENVVLRQSL